MRYIFFLVLTSPILLFGESITEIEAVNYCIILHNTGDLPFAGINLNDPNTSYSMNINWQNRITNLIFSYNKAGKLVYYKGLYGEVSIIHNSKSILVTKQSNYLCPDSQTFILYETNNEGLIISSTEKCGNQKTYMQFKHSKNSDGRFVSIICNDTLLMKYVFIYDKHINYFQWEVIQNGTIVPKFKQDRFGIWTQFPLDILYRQVMIKKSPEKTVENDKNLNKNKFEISDMNGKVIGTIEVSKTKIKL